MDNEKSSAKESCKYTGSRFMWGYLIFSGAAVYFLLTEHLAHTIAYLPFLLFLACPLMHLFMHHGHQHGHRDEKSSNQGSNKENGK